MVEGYDCIGVTLSQITSISCGDIPFVAVVNYLLDFIVIMVYIVHDAKSTLRTWRRFPYCIVRGIVLPVRTYKCPYISICHNCFLVRTYVRSCWLVINTVDP